MSGIREGASHSHSQNEISQPRSGELGPTRLCGLTTFSTVCVCVCRQLSTYFLPVGSKPLEHCEIKRLEEFLRSRLLYFLFHQLTSPGNICGKTAALWTLEGPGFQGRLHLHDICQQRHASSQAAQIEEGPGEKNRETRRMRVLETHCATRE